MTGHSPSSDPRPRAGDTEPAGIEPADTGPVGIDGAISALAAGLGLGGAAEPVEGDGRDAEHLAGRRAAARALAAAGSSSTVVGGAAGGPPVWPAGWRGSISHTATVAIAVTVADPTGDRLVGVDIEHDGALPDDDAEAVLVPSERDGRATLRWSAKESAYKAWSRLGIDPVDPLTIITEIDGHELRATGLGPSLTGRWVAHDALIITLLTGIVDQTPK